MVENSLNGWRDLRGIFLAGALLLAAWFAIAWRSTPIDPETGTAAIVDAQSAWRLRRMGLVITNSRLAQVDSYASFPDSVSCTDLPLFDELGGLAAGLFLGGDIGAPGVPVDEVALQVFGGWVGPVLLALWLVALYTFLRRSARVSRAAALFALCVVAASPIVVEAGRPGTIWIELFVAILYVLQLKALFGVWRARQLLDRYANSMIAGGLGSIGLATTPIFILAIVATWLAFLIAVLRAGNDERPNWLRCTLLFSMGTAVGGLLPAIGGPWIPPSGGPIAAWTQLWGWCVLLGLVPFLGTLWRPKWSSDSMLSRITLGVVAIILGAGLTALYRMGPEHQSSALLFAAVGWDASGPWAEHFRGSAFLLVWCVPFLFAVVRTAAQVGAQPEASRENVTIAIFGISSLVAAVLHPPLALLFAAPAAYALARLVDDPSRRALALGLLPIALVWSLLGGTSQAHPDSSRDRLEALAAARWLRLETEPPGLWNSVHSGQRWGVLCAPSIAALVAFHGRRPCAAPGVRRNGDVAGSHRLNQILGAASMSELVKEARELGIEYLVVGPRSAETLGRYGARADMIEALLTDRPDPATGVEMVWESPQGGPARRIAIFAIEESGAGREVRKQLRPSARGVGD